MLVAIFGMVIAKAVNGAAGMNLSVWFAGAASLKDV
jgi:hypothetical protein